MPPKPRPVVRTVRFFRIFASKLGKPEELAPLEIKPFLASYGQRSQAGRRHVLNRTPYQFDVSTATGDRDLVVHKLKSEVDMLSKLGHSGGIEEVAAVDDAGNFADTSAVVFMDFGNVFGIIGSAASSSSPRGSIIAAWLNDLKVLGPDMKFEVVPFSTMPDLAKIATNSGARRVTVTVPAEVSIKGGESSFGNTLRELKSEYPDGVISISVSYGQRTPTQTVRQRIADGVRDIASAVEDGAKAQASILRELPPKKKGGQPSFQSEVVDLVQSQIADDFTFTSDDGSISIERSITAIKIVAEREKDALGRAWESVQQQEN